MRTQKLAGALVVVLAFTAVATATASAAALLWELLPKTTGTAITGKTGKRTLQIKAAAVSPAKNRPPKKVKSHRNGR